MPPRSPRRPSEIVADDLRARIAAGEWQTDEALPSTHDLAAHYGVATSTITRALRTLSDEGLIRTVARWGTFRT